MYNCKVKQEKKILKKNNKKAQQASLDDMTTTTHLQPKEVPAWPNNMARQHEREKIYNEICPCWLKYQATWWLPSK